MAQNIGILDLVLGEGATNSLINAAGGVLAEQQKTRQAQIDSETKTGTALAEAQAWVSKNQTPLYMAAGVLLVLVALKMAKVF